MCGKGALSLFLAALSSVNPGSQKGRRGQVLLEGSLGTFGSGV